MAGIIKDQKEVNDYQFVLTYEDIIDLMNQAFQTVDYPTIPSEQQLSWSLRKGNGASIQFRQMQASDSLVISFKLSNEDQTYTNWSDIELVPPITAIT